MINCFSCCMPKGFMSACFIEKAPLDYALDYGTVSNRPCSLLHSGVNEACPLHCMNTYNTIEEAIFPSKCIM